MSPARSEDEAEALRDGSRWLTKDGAAKCLGVSERTVENYIAERKLGTRQQPIAGRRPMTVVDAGDVERLHAEQHRGSILSTVNLPPDTAPVMAQRAPELAGALIEGIRNAVRPPALVSSFLTIDAAAGYIGLPVRLLRKLIRQGRLASEAFGGETYVKRRDLEGIEFFARCEDRASAGEALRDGAE